MPEAAGAIFCVLVVIGAVVVINKLADRAHSRGRMGWWVILGVISGGLLLMLAEGLSRGIP